MAYPINDTSANLVGSKDKLVLDKKVLVEKKKLLDKKNLLDRIKTQSATEHQSAQTDGPNFLSQVTSTVAAPTAHSTNRCHGHIGKPMKAEPADDDEGDVEVEVWVD